MSHTFIADLESVAAARAPADIIGFARQVRKNRDHYAVEVVDISGAKWFRLPKTGSKPKRGERISLALEPGSTPDENFVVTRYRVIAASPMSGEDRDVERLERGSRLMLSRVMLKAGELLRHEDFVEFDSRIIVSDNPKGGLEPLQLRYPGFGTPVTLATSPAAQIVDFMNATGVARAFTNSTSFATSYRFPSASVESRIIMGKMKELRDAKLLAWLHQICYNVLSFIDHRRFAAATASEQIERLLEVGLTVEDDVLQNQLVTHIGSQVRRVIRLQSRNASIVLEGYEEFIGDRFVFSGFTFYPAHILELTQMGPRRHVRYLKRATNWSD